MSTPFFPDEFRQGDPLTAKYRNARNDAIKALGGLTGSTGVNIHEGSSSRLISIVGRECADIKLTTTANSDGGYGAKEVFGATAGTWIDSGRVMPQGSDPAYERDHNVSLLANDRVYRACRNDQTGEWIFRDKANTGAGGPNGSMQGCNCATPPATLYMTIPIDPCSEGLLNGCTLQYGPTPSSLGPLHLGTNCYLSTSLFTDTATGDQFYYLFGCFAAIMRISRVFPSSIFGPAFLDSVIYYWSVGLPGNTCVPFLLSNGQIYSGGDPNCDVTISE